MKISYRTHPALKYLHEGLNEIYLRQSDTEHFYLRCKSENNCTEIFKESIPSFASQITHLSKTFCEAVNASAKKILNHDLLEKYFADKSPKGTILFLDYCIFFDLESPLIVILRGKSLLFFLKGGNEVSRHITYFSESYYKEILGSKYEYSMVVGYVFYQLFSVLGFMKLCPVETKNVNAKSKTQVINCKYVNETDFNIQYLDSKWFTTLVKSEAFKVRGHFRLQPCGEGLKDRKLIWINEFQKEGYTAPARKLSADL